MFFQLYCKSTFYNIIAKGKSLKRALSDILIAFVSSGLRKLSYFEQFSFSDSPYLLILQTLKVAKWIYGIYE